MADVEPSTGPVMSSAMADAEPSTGPAMPSAMADIEPSTRPAVAGRCGTRGRGPMWWGRRKLVIYPMASVGLPNRCDGGTWIDELSVMPI